jgi:hypothetical protein
VVGFPSNSYLTLICWQQYKDCRSTAFGLLHLKRFVDITRVLYWYLLEENTLQVFLSQQQQPAENGLGRRISRSYHWWRHVSVDMPMVDKLLIFHKGFADYWLHRG